MVVGKKEDGGMRIGIDARMSQESGVGRYIRNLIFNLARLDRKNDYFIFLLKKDLREKLPKNFIKVEANFGWYGLAEQVRFPRILSTYQLDLVHFPHFDIPIFYRGKFVVTIHDLIHQHFAMKRATSLDPVTFRIKRLGYGQIFRAAVRKSAKILVPSNFVKEQLINEWSVDDGKIIITSEGVEEQLIAKAGSLTPAKISKVLQKFAVLPPYIFYVGNAHPHKNVEGLIAAFRKLKIKELKLVLAGSDHYFWQSLKDQYQDKDIIYTGFVTDEELVALYKEAALFIMPSFEEGFGIPILEAMAVGVPVVSSNAGALKEVGGEAAVYFDPTNINDISAKISEVLNSAKIRYDLIEKGKKRYQQFSWEKLAKETLEVYKGIGK